MRYISRSSEDTFAFGGALARALAPGDSVLLYGDMGAGKSVLARGAAREWGVTEPMASPTFTLMQPYDGARGGVFHFDLYRISDYDEFHAAGLEEFVGADALSLIEWPQQADILPDRRVEIDIERGAGEHTRVMDVSIYGLGGRAAQVIDNIRAWEAKANEYTGD